jgi:hypothetical protein
LQSPYEAPLSPDLTIDMIVLSSSDATHQVVALVKRKFIEAREVIATPGQEVVCPG